MVLNARVWPIRAVLRWVHQEGPTLLCQCPLCTKTQCRRGPTPHPCPASRVSPAAEVGHPNPPGIRRTDVPLPLPPRKLQSQKMLLAAPTQREPLP